MSELHPLMIWAAKATNSPTIAGIAAAVGCSESHLRNILANRKEPSLGLAKRLSDYTGGKVRIEAFLRQVAEPEAAE